MIRKLTLLMCGLMAVAAYAGESQNSQPGQGSTGRGGPKKTVLMGGDQVGPKKVISEGGDGIGPKRGPDSGQGTSG